jgi:predicted DNA-binding transcriptional regulator AlpA
MKLLRLPDIIGSKSKGIQALLPVSRSTFLNGVKQGIFPKPVNNLGGKICAWRSSDIESVVKGTYKPSQK